jgi:hypothetical protein
MVRGCGNQSLPRTEKKATRKRKNESGEKRDKNRDIEGNAIALKSDCPLKDAS